MTSLKSTLDKTISLLSSLMAQRGQQITQELDGQRLTLVEVQLHNLNPKLTALAVAACFQRVWQPFEHILKQKDSARFAEPSLY